MAPPPPHTIVEATHARSCVGFTWGLKKLDAPVYIFQGKSGCPSLNFIYCSDRRSDMKYSISLDNSFMSIHVQRLRRLDQDAPSHFTHVEAYQSGVGFVTRSPGSMSVKWTLSEKKTLH